MRSVSGLCGIHVPFLAPLRVLLLIIIIVIML